MKTLEQYHPWRALRPFSLVVALVSAGLGVLLAWQQGFAQPWHAALVLAGATLAQAGVNLINDLEDLSRPEAQQAPVRRRILANAGLAALAFALSLAVAVYFTRLHGPVLLALVSVSALLALSYNLGPINFKARGLALLQVFVLMGVCLVQGAYLAMSGAFSVEALALSLPVSLLVSALLLSNELRDWEGDRRHGVATVTVRIGYRRAVWLYAALVALAYATALGQLRAEQWPLAWLLLLPAPLLWPLARLLRSTPRERLTPLTGRFFLLFGLAWMALQLPR